MKKKCRYYLKIIIRPSCHKCNEPATHDLMFIDPSGNHFSVRSYCKTCGERELSSLELEYHDIPEVQR